MSKRFFSAESAHGSSSSYGFSNDTVVYAFGSKKDRDNYVDKSKNISCRKIIFSEVTKMAANVSLTMNNNGGRPKPFSCEYWGIVNCGFEDFPEGCIGRVEVCVCDGDYGFIERLYK